MLESSARALDAAGAFPAPPEALGGVSLTELLGQGALTFRVDPKFPQAIGITNILKMVLTFGNSGWELLRNPFADSPFFTSDFPAAVEPSADPRVINRIVPLTPFLAVRLCPDIYLDRAQPLTGALCRGPSLLPGRSPVGQAVHLEARWLSCGDANSGAQHGRSGSPDIAAKDRATTLKLVTRDERQ